MSDEARIEDLSREAVEQRRRAHRFIDEIYRATVDIKQRRLLRRILHAVGDAVDEEDLAEGRYLPHPSGLYDNTRLALSLVEKFERTGHGATGTAALSAVVSALHAAEDAASEASRLAR